jgi:hypothetical protein
MWHNRNEGSYEKIQISSFILDIFICQVEFNQQHFHSTKATVQISSASNDPTLMWQGTQLGLMKLMTKT